MSVVHEVPVEPRCRVIWANEATKLDSLPQLIRRILAVDGLALMMGDAGCGKSTLAVDIGCAVAAGNPWRGHPCERGLVLHLAGEGMHGLRMRLAAAILEGRGSSGMPYGIIPQSLDLAQPSDLGELMELIAAAESEVGEKLVLLIVDTLARCFGIDENDGAQMRQAIAACDQIRAVTGAAILIIHHVGKDARKGARGHSSLGAAVDTEMLVDGHTNPRTITITKQRDLPTVTPMAFDLEAVTVGIDPTTGESITACVVRHNDQPPPKAKRREPRGSNQQRLLAALQERVRASGSDVISSLDLREIAKAQGLSRQRFGEVRESLERDCWLVPSVGGVRLAGNEL